MAQTLASLIVRVAPSPPSLLRPSEEQRRTVCCRAHSSEVPKKEPFSQSRLFRAARDRSILEKAEQQILDKCSRLEGDDAYECWQAYLEFEDQKASTEEACSIAEDGEKAAACEPLERLQHLVLQSQGAANLISAVRLRAKVAERQKVKDSELERERFRSEFELPADNVELVEPNHPIRLSDAEVSDAEADNVAAEVSATDVDYSNAEPTGPVESAFGRVLKKRGLTAKWYRPKQSSEMTE